MRSPASAGRKWSTTRPSSTNWAACLRVWFTSGIPRSSLMSPILFYLFAALTLVFAVAVVANRNPVASALCLVVSFLGLAALFVGLDAYFIAVIQVLVYAGAVMV